MAACVRYAMHACKTEGQRLTTVGANTKALQDLAEGRWLDADRKITVLRQLW
jgi:hypothetical protein